MPARRNKWSQYDETSYRTGGMERVGYDADTQRYYFQEGADLYEGAPGAEFGGSMRYIGRAPVRVEPEVSSPSSTPPKQTWKKVAPFFLAVGRFLSSPSRKASSSSEPPAPPEKTPEASEASPSKDAET